MAAIGELRTHSGWQPPGDPFNTDIMRQVLGDERATAPWIESLHCHLAYAAIRRSDCESGGFAPSYVLWHIYAWEPAPIGSI